MRDVIQFVKSILVALAWRIRLNVSSCFDGGFVMKVFLFCFFKFELLFCYVNFVEEVFVFVFREGFYPMQRCMKLWPPSAPKSPR